MFVYTIWDIATVGLLAIGVVVCVLGCIAFVVKEIAIKAASKVNEIRGEEDEDL